MPAVTPSPQEIATIAKLQAQLDSTRSPDELKSRYYQGRQRIEQLGMAVPPSMSRFVVITNWPRVVVDTKEARQQVRALIMPGDSTADPKLRAIWDASNMDVQVKMFNRDRMVFGRAMMSVAANPDDPQLPIIRAESPREMAVLVDPPRERVTAAARFFGVDDQGSGPTNVTLFLPDVTVWIQKINGRWSEVGRDNHNLGRVPVVVHLNRRTSAGWFGESEMTDIIPLTDAAARSLTNLQFSQEAHGIPRMIASGVSRADFVDAAGKPLPKWESYFNAVWALSNPQSKVSQLTASDLKNFETAMRMYGQQAATVTGFPGRYFGLTTANPAAEGAIRAEEAELVRSVESDNAEVGISLGWIGALAWRFATGQWVRGNQLRTDWFNPATPTVAQRTDALVKMRQVGALSREGMWDELGWDDARKSKERAYFEQESADPAIERIAAAIAAGADAT